MKFEVGASEPAGGNVWTTRAGPIVRHQCVGPATWITTRSASGTVTRTWERLLADDGPAFDSWSEASASLVQREREARSGALNEPESDEPWPRTVSVPEEFLELVRAAVSATSWTDPSLRLARIDGAMRVLGL